MSESFVKNIHRRRIWYLTTGLLACCFVVSGVPSIAMGESPATSDMESSADALIKKANRLSKEYKYAEALSALDRALAETDGALALDPHSAQAGNVRGRAQPTTTSPQCNGSQEIRERR